MGKRLLVAFVPKPEVSENISKLREIAQISIKKNSGLKTPHITIVDNSFSDVKKVDKILQRISKESNSFTAEIKGIGTFKAKSSGVKKYEKSDSLVYIIKNNSLMNRFRKKVLLELNHLKTKERLNHLVMENKNLSNKSISNITKYGSPFGLKEWKFHATVGLIPKKNQKEILRKMKNLKLNNEWKIDYFCLFVRKNGWVLFKKYPLK